MQYLLSHPHMPSVLIASLMLTSVLAFSSLLSNPGIPANGSDLKQRVEQLERDRATMEETMVRMRRHITQLESTVDRIHGFEQIGSGYRISAGGSALEISDSGISIDGALNVALNAGSGVSIGAGGHLELVGNVISMNGSDLAVARVGDRVQVTVPLVGGGTILASGNIIEGSPTLLVGN